jgi:hypothetical protein
MEPENTSNWNGHDRWANIWSPHAQALAICHVEQGGSLDADDEENGLTVQRLKDHLLAARPGETLPNDSTLYCRIGLLRALIYKQNLIENFERNWAVVVELGRELQRDLEIHSGEPLGIEAFPARYEFEIPGNGILQTQSDER